MKKLLNIVLVLLIFGCVKAQNDSVVQNNAFSEAYYNYKIKDYKLALQYIKPYYDNGTADEYVYQLLGNIYRESGNKFKSFAIYSEGMQKFPNSGCLYFEKGNQKLMEGEYTQANYWYEKGIDVQPMYDMNYYGTTEVFFMSTETIWAIMYGELFMILSNNDTLQMQISKQLFDAYFSSLSLNKGKTVAHFNNNIIVYSDSFERKNLYPNVFDNLMSEASSVFKFVDIANLQTIRKKFLSLLEQKNADFMNPLFSYWKQIMSAGYWEAYNYWLFAYGNNNESATWINKNKQQWNAFLTWKKQNPIVLTPDNHFSRYLME